MTSKQNSRLPPLPCDNKDTQAEIIMAEKRDTSSISSRQHLEMTMLSMTITALQKVAPNYFYNPDEQ